MKRILTGILCVVLLLSCIPVSAEQTTPEETTNPPATEAPVTEPETTAPESTLPPTTQPETTIPETTIPETTIPETTIPETTQPENTEPETTDPMQITGVAGPTATWHIDLNTGVLTISGTGEMTVQGSQQWGQYNTQITAIVVKEGITAIGDSAFGFACGNATSVSLPNTLERIGKFALAGTSISHLTIPSSVKSIGREAFRGSRNLKSFTFPNTSISIDRAIFLQCTGLTAVTIPSSWTVVPSDTFDGCTSLSQITIPASVRTINNNAFGQCKALSVVNFLGDAPEFKESAFYNNTFTAIYPADNSTWTESVLKQYGGSVTWKAKGDTGPLFEGSFGKTDIYTWKLENSVLYITGDGYMYWPDETPPWYSQRGMIKKVVMTGNMTNIYSNAFQGCSNLTDIVWPTGLKSLYEYTFASCIALKEIAIPDTVTSIGRNSFQFCSSLQSVKLPNSLKYINPGTFYGCTSLPTITIPAKVTSLMSSCFAKCTQLKTVYFTGNMPAISGEQYSPGAFIDIPSLTAYYPARNSTWKAAEIAKVEAYYTKGQVKFLPNDGSVPTDTPQDEPVTTFDPDLTLPEGETPTTDPMVTEDGDITSPDTTQIQDPVQTPADTTQPQETSGQENVEQPSTSNQQPDIQKPGKYWYRYLPGGAVILAIAILTLVAFGRKKK